MDKIVIKGFPQYEGSYDFDLNGEYSNRELAWIRQYSKYLPAGLSEGLAGGDAALWCILAAIALRRAGKITDAREVAAAFELLMDGPYSSTVEPEFAEAGEADADGPPPSRSSSNGGTSGAASNPSSEIQANPPSPTGIPGSATSVSPPPRSGS